MDYKIVIDPGHGGIDSGASGNGIIEKLNYNTIFSNLNINNQVGLIAYNKKDGLYYFSNTNNYFKEKIYSISISNDEKEIYVCLSNPVKYASFPASQPLPEYTYIPPLVVTIPPADLNLDPSSAIAPCPTAVYCPFLIDIIA